MKRFMISSILMLAVTLVAACGSGGGGGEGGTGSGGSGTGPRQYSKAIVKISTSSAFTAIGGVDATLVLPAGVTVKAATNPPNTDLGVVVASGVASPASAMASGVYTTASNTVRVVVVSELLSGFNSGEYVTLNCDIATGNFPTGTDFTVSTLHVYDVNGAAINGVTASVSVSFM